MNARKLFTTILFCGVASILCAQQTIVPPPKPIADGPARDETLQSIESALNGIGKIGFLECSRSIKLGQAYLPDTFSREFSKVAIDRNQCQLTSHLLITRAGKTTFDGALALSLRDVKELVIAPYPQYWNKDLAGNDRNELRCAAFLRFVTIDSCLQYLPTKRC